ncbi:MAG: amidohydrolase, partial [Bauldia sp.]
VETVMVNGTVVARNGKPTLVDEDALLAEVRAEVGPWLAAHADLERRNRVFEPFMAEIHRRATMQDIGMNRYAGDMPAWPGMNRPTT